VAMLKMRARFNDEHEYFLHQFPTATLSECIEFTYLQMINIVTEQIQSTHAILQKEGGEKDE